MPQVVEKLHLLKDFRCKYLWGAKLGQSPRREMSIKNPSTARFLFQLIKRRKRAGAVKGKGKTERKGWDL